jgi:putative flippase GtrA
MIVLIPAYQPGQRLLDLIGELHAARPSLGIVVVDDGSGPDYDCIFAAAEGAGCTVLRHARNHGKGFALKEGFRYIAAVSPVEQVVTADCDGQHSARDILRVGDRVADSAGVIVLGSRRFGPDVPARSRVGNTLSSLMSAPAIGRRLRDTQTGLRGFPASSLEWLVEVPGDRFDYEFRTLLSAERAGVLIEELDIETIYLDHNASSHFRAVADSVRVVAPLGLFALSGFVAFAIDTLALLALTALTGSMLLAVIGARIVSATANFATNRLVVFDRRRATRTRHAAVRYFTLALVLLAANYGMLDALTNAGVPLLAAKVVTEASLFAVSFTVQRDVVFSPGRLASDTGSRLARPAVEGVARSRS